MARYVALLRGINVGGNNVIKMADLRASFEAMGLADVETLIASGNVVFSAKQARAALTRTIEKTLSHDFDYASRVLVISASDLAAVVAQAPKGFGTQPAKYRYDVLFVIEPLTSTEALAQVPVNPAVDAAAAGDHALYFTRLVAKASKSHLSKLVQKPAYQHLTVRNWNTTTKLLAMVSGTRS